MGSFPIIARDILPCFVTLIATNTFAHPIHNYQYIQFIIFQIYQPVSHKLTQFVFRISVVRWYLPIAYIFLIYIPLVLIIVFSVGIGIKIFVMRKKRLANQSTCVFIFSKFPAFLVKNVLDPWCMIIMYHF